VISTHLLNAREKDADTARTKAQMSFSQCKMQAFESLADFKTRFELRRHIYATTWKAGGDCEFRISDATAFTYFIERKVVACQMHTVDCESVDDISLQSCIKKYIK